jgi:putative Holliday junction resolvase
VIPALGLDAGTVRIGVAASDPTGTLASPVAVIPATHVEGLWAQIQQQIDSLHPQRLVVGLPRHLDGTEGEAARMAREFAAEAGRRTGLPVDLWDERLTTVAAERTMIAAGTRRNKRRQTIDAAAAAIMLQGWLDSRRNRRR